MKTPLLIAVSALKSIQYVYSGAGRSYEDLCEVKEVAERALKKLGIWEMSLYEFQKTGRTLLDRKYDRL